MRMTQELCISPELAGQMETEAQLALEMVGGASDGLFPRVEALFLAMPEKYAEAMDFIGQTINIKRYLSYTDFLVCGVYTKYEWHCKKHKDEGGPQLSAFVPEEDRGEMENLLLLAVGFANHLMERSKTGGSKKIPMSWFRGEIRKAERIRNSGVMEIDGRVDVPRAAYKAHILNGDDEVAFDVLADLTVLKMKLCTIKVDADKAHDFFLSQSAEKSLRVIEEFFKEV